MGGLEFQQLRASGERFLLSEQVRAGLPALRELATLLDVGPGL